MTRTWMISIPVWGRPYVNTFITHALPSLRIALKQLREPYKLVIHTDDPHRIKSAIREIKCELYPVARQPTYVALQMSHADAVARAKIGEVVVLLNADLVVSRNMFTSCAAHFDAGNKAIVLVGIRTDINGHYPPVGATSRKLLEWAWTNRHTIIKDLEWGSGTSLLPTNLFFTNNNATEVVMRGFHLHPVAIYKERDIPFKSTIDGDLLDHFKREHIHVVVDPDDMSMLEISPSDKRFPISGRKLSPSGVVASMRTRASPLHQWLFQHRIVVKGTGKGCQDQHIADQVTHLLAPRR